MIESIDDDRGRTGAQLTWGLMVWLAASVAFALSGVLPRLPAPAVPVIIFGTTVAVGMATWRCAGVPAWLASTDLRIPIAVHVIRAPVGAWFLALGARGLLHPRFVAVAGYGDILAGGAALVALLALTISARRAKTIVWLFNVVAALDILAVLITAQRIILFGPGMSAMQGLFAFPGPMIPTLLVPLVLLTHMFIFWRLRRWT